MNKKVYIYFVLAIAVFSTFFLFLTDSEKQTVSKNNSAEEVKSAEQTLIEKYQKLYTLAENETNADLEINAKAAIIIDAQNGKIIYQQNANQALPPASIAKIMTATITLENYSLEEKITVSEKAANTEPNKIVMRAGEKMTVNDLLHGLIMISANDAAEVLAEGIDGNRETFIAKMNEKARLLGLSNTKFKNPSGLDDPEQYSSAYDIAKITYYAIKTQPKIIDLLGCDDTYSVYPGPENDSHWWPGHISSTLRAYPEMIGAKTGYTDEADNTFLGVAERNGQKIIFVFLGSTQGNEDAKNLLFYGLDNL